MGSMTKSSIRVFLQVVNLQVRDPLQEPALYHQLEKAKLRGTTFTFDLSSPQSTE